MNHHTHSKPDATFFIVDFHVVMGEQHSVAKNSSGKSCRPTAEIAGHGDENHFLRRTRPVNSLAPGQKKEADETP